MAMSRKWQLRPTLVVFGRAPTSSRAVFKGNLHWIGVARILLGRNVESKV